MLAVALGAGGAHALQPRLEAAGRVDVWETAVLYHVAHGLALLILGVWQAVDARAAKSLVLRVAEWFLLGGIVAFSGSLYLISLGGPWWLGPVTPLGGGCFLVGWALVAIVSWGSGRKSDTPV